MLERPRAAVLLVGLTAYAVLGGADFGAGFWDLTAGGAERGARLRGLDQALHGPGLGGEPRLADLRARGVLDVLPERLRPGHGDALRAALPRCGRDHPARRRLRPARGGGDDRRGARRSGRPSRSPRCSTPSSSAPPSGLSPPGQVAVEDPGERVRQLDNATSLYAGALAVATGAYVAAVFLAADAVRADVPDLAAALSRPGARRGRGGRRPRDRRPRRRRVRCPRALRRSDLGRGLVIVDRLGGRRARHGRPGLGAPIRSRALHVGGRRWARSSSDWASPSGPTSFPAS